MNILEVTLLYLLQCGYSSPTQDALSRDLKLTVSEDDSFLYMGRLLEGFGVGIISYTVHMYIAEIAPQNMREGLGLVNQLGVTIGIMLAYFLGLFVSWRVLAILGHRWLDGHLFDCFGKTPLLPI